MALLMVPGESSLICNSRKKLQQLAASKDIPAINVRSTATQEHCHVHKDVLDEVNVNDLMNEFIMSKNFVQLCLGTLAGLNN
jgi:hypothetical protein